MSLIFLIIAVLCGIVLIVEIDTGNLTPLQVAGIGIISLAIAGVVPTSWPVVVRRE